MQETVVDARGTTTERELQNQFNLNVVLPKYGIATTSVTVSSQTNPISADDAIANIATEASSQQPTVASKAVTPTVKFLGLVVLLLIVWQLVERDS